MMPTAKFMYSLGLKQYPSLDEIIRIASLGDADLRTKALKYLLAHFTSRYSNYTPSVYSDVAFVPALRDGKSALAKPSEVRSSWTGSPPCLIAVHRSSPHLNGLY